MNSASVQLPDPAAWQPLHLRLTAFPINPAAAMERDWWREAFGQPPETSTRKKHLHTDTDVIQEMRITLTVDPQNMNWVFQPVVDPMNFGPDLATLAPLPEALAGCAELFAKAFGCLPAVRRLAFGGMLAHKVQDHEEGYRFLDAYLPDVTLSPDSSDFSYSINRKRPSKSGIEGLYINRLSKWSILRWELRAGVISVAMPPPTHLVREDGGFACLVDLDINTPAEREDPLPVDQLSAIWAELVALGFEIAARGDIP